MKIKMHKGCAKINVAIFVYLFFYIIFWFLCVFRKLSVALIKHTIDTKIHGEMVVVADTFFHKMREAFYKTRRG